MQQATSPITIVGRRHVIRGRSVVDTLVGFSYVTTKGVIKTGVFDLNDSKVCQVVSHWQDDAAGTAERIYKVYVDSYIQTHPSDIHNDTIQVFRVHLHDFVKGADIKEPDRCVRVVDQEIDHIHKRVYFEHLLGTHITDLECLAKVLVDHGVEELYAKILIPLTPIQTTYQLADRLI